MKSFGCASSRDFLPRRRRSTRCREKKRRRKTMGGKPLLRGGILRPPPSPRAAEAAEEQVPGAGAEAPAAERSTEEVAHAAEVPVRTAEASGSATVATSVVASAPVKPSRKRKRGFSTLR
jgi:hypothetical protein